MPGARESEAGVYSEAVFPEEKRQLSHYRMAQLMLEVTKYGDETYEWCRM